ncbi:hypothetical protein [Lactococcus chungangensis]|uniref:hypothetical protein n=1 Tax=Pseudolactococcus chungangensis TaxID=451457 RepID=UPI0037369FD8
MMIYKNAINFMEYLLSIIIVIEFASVYSHFDSYVSNILNVFTIMILLLLIVTSFLYLTAGHKISAKLLLIIVSYYIFFVFPFIFMNNRMYPIGSLFVLQLFLLPLMLFYFEMCFLINNPWSLLDKICKIIYIVAIISMFFWLLCSVFKVISPTGTVTTDWGPKRQIPSYYGVYFETQPINFGSIDTVRNSGIYTESPMFAFTLSLCYGFRVFIQKKSARSNILLILSMISTMTSTSVIILLGSALVVFLENTKFNKKIQFLIGPLILIIVIYLLYLIALQKITTGESFSVRMDDVHAAFLAWLQNPLFGNGIGNFESLINKMSSARTALQSHLYIGFSSGFMQILALGGIFLELIYTIPIFAFGIANHSKYGFYGFVFSGMILILFFNLIISFEWLFLILLPMLFSFSIFHLGKPIIDDQETNYGI